MTSSLCRWVTQLTPGRCCWQCQGWGDYAGATGGSSCEHEAFGWVAVLYFSSFVLFSSFLLLNLFIGVITSAMSEASAELHKEKKEAARLAIATRLKAKADRAASRKEGNPIFQDELEASTPERSEG